MEDFRQQFLGRAFRTVPGVEYNRRRRELLEQADMVPVIYEIVLPERGGWETFRDATFPLLVRYLKAQGVDPENPRRLVVALFFKDHCHFIQGTDFMKALCGLEGLNAAALHFRVLGWLSKTEAAASAS
jgi:hypothetical protein